MSLLLEANSRIAATQAQLGLRAVPSVNRFKPFRPKAQPLLRWGDLALIFAGLMMILAAFASYPNGMRGRFGNYVPPSAISFYRWMFGIDGVIIISIVALVRYCKWRKLK